MTLGKINATVNLEESPSGHYLLDLMHFNTRKGVGKIEDYQQGMGTVKLEDSQKKKGAVRPEYHQKGKAAVGKEDTLKRKGAVKPVYHQKKKGSAKTTGNNMKRGYNRKACRGRRGVGE